MNKKLISILFILIFFGIGCLNQRPSPSAPAPKETTASSQAADQAYYDFDDIPVPQEMKLEPKKSILFESAGVKAGVLVFRGRVNALSLFNYYINSMPQADWKLRSYFKYGQYLLVFEKPNKDCVIHIKDNLLDTELQIWVTPRVTQ